MVTPATAIAPDAAPSTGVFAELRALVKLGAPLAAFQVGYSMMSFVDTLVAGRAGAEALAATGLGSSLFFAVSILGIGVGLGLDPLVAQALGAGRRRDARHAMWQGVHLGVAIALPSTALVLLSPLLLPLFGVTRELTSETQAYLWGRAPSVLPLFITVSQRAYLQASHRTGAIVAAIVVSNVVNLVGNWVLLFGDAGLARLGLPALGLPALGVFGIGFASTLATLVQLAILMPAIAAVPVDAGPVSMRRPSRAVLRRLWALGAPVGLQLLAEVGVFALVGVIMGGLGARAAAAHQVALMAASMTFSACVGIGAATSVRVGHAIGRGDAAGTRRAGLTGIGLGAAFMLAPSLVMAVWPEVVARFMTTDPSLAPAAAQLLRVAAAFQVADGVQAVASGALRGAGLTRWSFVANVVAHWGLGLPCALLLGFSMGLGPVGLWWGLTLGLLAVAVALTWKFRGASRTRIDAVAPSG